MKHFRKLALVLTIVFLTQKIFGQGWSVNPSDYSFSGEIDAIVFHGTSEVTTGTLGAFVGSTCRGFVNGTFFPLTGKTVFLLLCYSNQASGETLTFKYFDPAGSIYYDIKETEGFVSNMQVGNGLSPMQYHTVPLVFAVTGGGASYCQGGSGSPVGLADSESGVTYTLIINGIPTGTTQNGTGASISFGNQLAGTYTVSGNNSGGTISMSGSALITENPLPSQPGTITGTTPQCPGLSGQIYSISPVPNATTYNWSVPGGWTITAGAGTTSITVTTGSAGQNGNISVTSGNSCGTSSPRTLPVTVNPATPATPGPIGGTTSQCPGLTGQTYSISSVANATTYNWAVPTGWTITAGSGTISITVTTGSSGQNGNVTVTAGNSCGTSSASSLPVTVNPGTPATPGVISGLSGQCPGQPGQVYSISSVPNATTYTWTVPIGWSITSGAGTTSVTVTTGSSGQNGNISVTANNSCGTSSQRTLAVTVASAPATPGSISGTAAQCPGHTGQIYSISSVPNATTYTWLVPAGWTITSGAGTTSITVTTGSSGQNGNISVTASNSCGTSSPSNLGVTVNPDTPATPGAISGISAQCAGLTGQVYSIITVPTATTYTWTVPTGWTVTSGAGTTSITVTTGSDGQNGNISVTAGNSCGTSSASTLAVTVTSAPAIPGTITGTTVQCPGLTGQVYSISAVPRANTYTWTVPTGWTITSGAGTTSITVTTGSAGQNGNISVTAGNTCGISPVRTLGVSVNAGSPATPGVISGPSAQCSGLTGQVYSISAVPNASTYTWTVPAGWTITAGAGTTSITVTSGSPGQNGNISVTAANGCGTSLPSVLAVTVVANPTTPVTILTQPTCSVGTGTITVTSPTGAGMTYSIDGINYSNTTGIFNSVVPGTYLVTARNATGCTSPGSIVTINAQPPTPIVNNQTASISSGGSFSITPSGATIPVGTTYTWPAPTYTGFVTGGVAQPVPQTSISGTLTNPSGVGTAIYTVTPTFGPCTGATFLVTVTVTSTCVPVSITTQPGNSSVCAISGNAPFTVVAGGTGPFTYQWQYNNSGTWGSVTNGIPAGAVYTNSTTAAMNVTGISVPSVYQYRCLVTNCGGGNILLSNSATLTINAPPVPTLTSSDADNIFCFGTSVTFTAGGGGVGANYDFRVNGVTVQTGPTNTCTRTDLGNAQIVTVVVTNASLCSATSAGIANAQIVTVVVTNASLCSATSAGIANFVNQPPFIISGPTATCAANFLTYSVVLTVSAGTVTSTSGIVANTGGNNWSITGILAGVNITITITDVNGCITTQPVAAPNCLCPVLLPPVSGGDKSYCTGGVIPTLSATVAAGGNPKTIDWYNSSSGGILLLSASLTYTPTVAGTYYALTREIVSNCVSSTRTPIVLTMNPLPIPTLTSSDADNVFCSGTSIVFTATGGTSYNFFVSGTSVQNGAGATYTTSSLTNGQAVSVVVTNANGCIATSAAITNTVNPTPVPTLTSSDADNIFCAGTSVTFTAGGGTSYDFRIGGVSAQSGSLATFTTGTLTNGQVVNVVVSNTNGCSATSLSITNTVNPSPTPTLTSSDADNIFCTGTSVTFTATGGTSYNFRVGGVSVQNSASPTYTTSSLTSGQAVDVIVGNSIGCTVTSSVITNTVYPQPSGNAGTGGNVCDLSFKLNALPSIGIGTWTKTSGPGIATFAPNANTPNTAVTVSEYGTYTFTWTEISGTCSGSSTITVNFYLQPVANPGVGGNNCGLGFRFNGSLNAGVGTWSKVSGPGNVSFSPDANSATALATVSAYGTYVFKWTVNNGTCSHSANITVIFIQQASASAGLGGNECDKDFNLNALVPVTGTGTWTKSLGPGNAVFTPDNHQPNAKVTVDQFGAYEFTWTVVNSTCASSDVVKVVFHDLPAINAGADVAICKGNSIQLLAQGTGTVSWVPAALLSNPNILNPVATPDATTTFTVNLTDQFGCKNSDNIVVEVREKPLAKAGPDQVLGYLFEAQMDAVLAYNYEKGLWSVISGTGKFTDTTDAKSVVKNLSSGDNKFLWLVTNGVCPNSQDTIMIKVNDFIIPTLITPNMDGRNDYFVLRGLATLGKTELVIFDRRGAQVYRNLNYDNTWNGVDYNKNPLPDDTYFLVLRTSNGKSISGYIVIRR